MKMFIIKQRALERDARYQRIGFIKTTTIEVVCCEKRNYKQQQPLIYGRVRRRVAVFDTIGGLWFLQFSV